MYTLIVKDDNTIITTKRERIVQRSKLCDNFRILVPIRYKDMDMSSFEVTMFYQLPVSKERYSIILQKEPEIYKEDYLEYKIPADTWITKEAGAIQVLLTFTEVSMTDGSEVRQCVRKATGGIIEIASCEDWASQIADPLLQTIDQRIIQLQMVAKQMDEASQYLYENQVDDLLLDDDMLHVSVRGEKKGDGVRIIIPSNGHDEQYDGDNDGLLDLDKLNGTPGKPNHNCDCNCDCGDSFIEI